MKELLLGLRLVLEELNVVDQQHVDVAVALLAGLDARCAQRGDELGGELLARRVPDRELGVVAVEVVRDRAEEVGLAQPRSTVEEQGVVGLARQLRDGERRTVGEPIAVADHEALEGVRRVWRHGRSAARLVGGRQPPRAVVGHERDLPQRLGVRMERGGETRRVTTLNPGSDSFRTGDVESSAVRGDGPKRLEPQLVGGGRKRGSNLVANPLPDRREIVRQRLLHVVLRPSRVLCWSAPPEASRGARRARDYTAGSGAESGVPGGVAAIRGESPPARLPARRRGGGCVYWRRPALSLSQSPPGAASPNDEADLSAQEAEACPSPRFSRPHADARGAGRPAAPTAQGPQAADAVAPLDDPEQVGAERSRPAVPQRRLRARVS